MIWLLFLIAYTVLFAFSTLFQKTLMKQENSDARAQAVADSVTRGVVAIIVAVSLQSFKLLPLSVIPYFILIIILDAIATTSYYKALKTVQASLVGIIFATMFLWTTLSSSVILHETLTLAKIIGTTLIFGGILIALWKKQKVEFNKGLLFAFIAPFLWGFVITFSYYILRVYNAPSLEAYEDVFIALTILLLQPITFKKLNFYTKPKHAILMLTNGGIESIASICGFYAYQFGRNATIIAPLGSTRVILTLLLSTIFLKERDNLPRKLIGAVVVVGGCFLLLTGI